MVVLGKAVIIVTGPITVGEEPYHVSEAIGWVAFIALALGFVGATAAQEFAVIRISPRQTLKKEYAIEKNSSPPAVGIGVFVV